jgi:hypothetical protein
LVLFQHRWSEQKRLGVSAKEFANKYNLTVKSLTDQTFLTAGDKLFGCSFGDWVDRGNHADFNATDLRNYIHCLQSVAKVLATAAACLSAVLSPLALLTFAEPKS